MAGWRKRAWWHQACSLKLAKEKHAVSFTFVTVHMHKHLDNSVPHIHTHARINVGTQLGGRCVMPKPLALACSLISFVAYRSLWTAEHMVCPYRYTHSNIGCCCSYNYQLACVLLCCVEGRTLDSGAICTMPLIKQLWSTSVDSCSDTKVEFWHNFTFYCLLVNRIIINK